MVNEVNEAFMNKYFPNVKAGDKIDVAQAEITKRAVFENVDKNHDITVQQDELNTLQRSSELSEQQVNEFFTKYSGKNGFNLPKDAVETIVMTGENKQLAVIKLKKESLPAQTPNGVAVVDVSDENNPVVKETRTTDSNGLEEIIKYNSDNTTTTKKGNITTHKDANGRVTMATQNNGSLGIVKIEYEYENAQSTTPTKATKTDVDGTVTELTGDDIPSPENPFPTRAQAPQSSPAQQSSEEAEQTEGGGVENEENANETVDRSKPLYAKNGETFDATAKRLGFEKGTPEYNEFVAANKQAANKKWFVLSKPINIPDSLKEKVNADAYKVDKKEEEAKYIKGTKDKADISGYNDTNTQEKTLDKSTSWWMLAKQNLIDLGNVNPTNAQIYDRIGVLIALNENKEPTKGTALKIPTGAPVDSSDKADNTGAADSPENTGGAAQSSSQPANLSETQKARLQALGCPDEILNGTGEQVELWIVDKAKELAPEVVSQDKLNITTDPTFNLIYCAINHNVEFDVIESNNPKVKILSPKGGSPSDRIRITLDDNNNPIKVEFLDEYSQTQGDQQSKVQECAVYSKYGIKTFEKVNDGDAQEKASINPSDCNTDKMMEYVKLILEKLSS